MKEIVNIQHSIVKVIEERRLGLFGRLKMGSERISKLTLKRDVEGRKRKRTLENGGWMDELRRNIICRGLK